MSVLERSTTCKIEWHVSNINSKSHEIELEDGFKVCFGVKTIAYQHVIYLVSKSSQPSIYEIGEVLFTTCALPDDRRRMLRVSSEGPNSVHFAELSELKTPLTFACWISLRIMRTVTHYALQMGDTLLADQLWLSAKNGRLTDVEFQVGQAPKSKSFTAHRSILTARSPVFAGLFDKLEPSANNVMIEDVQPSVFKHFLRFVYTGQLQSSAMANLSELQALADRYQIETLQKLCRHPLQEMNASELTSLILSITYTPPSTKVDATNLFGRPYHRLAHMSPLLVGSDHPTSNLLANQQVGSTSALDRANFFFTGNPLTPAASTNTSDFTFPKLNQATGPMSFNFGNRTSTGNGASPVIALQAPGKFTMELTPSSACSISKGKNPAATSSTPSTSGTAAPGSKLAAASREGPSGGSQTASMTTPSASTFTFKQPVDVSSVTLKAAVVAAAVSRLRMVFDEFLGTEEKRTDLNDSFSKEAIDVSAPPPSPESHSQAEATFQFSQPQRVVPPSSSTNASSGFCSSFSFSTDDRRRSSHNLVQRSYESNEQRLSDGIKLEFPSAHSLHRSGEGDDHRSKQRSPMPKKKRDDIDRHQSAYDSRKHSSQCRSLGLPILQMPQSHNREKRVRETFSSEKASGTKTL